MTWDHDFEYLKKVNVELWMHLNLDIWKHFPATPPEHKF